MEVKFAEWLKSELDRRGWSQSQLVDEINRVYSDEPIARGTISNIVAGLRHPQPDTCAKIAAGLHLPVETVLRAADHLPPPDIPLADEFQQIHDLMKRMSVRERRELLDYALFRFRRSKKEEAEQ